MGSELLITLAVAWLYLTLVRFVDLNEREPVWALALVFVFGALGAGLAHLLVGSLALNATVWPGALAVETTKLLALAAGILVFSGIARVRGWSEFSDVVDGLVYGITVGLGWSAGETFVRELQAARFASLHLVGHPWQSWLRAAAAGLSHGVFGAMVGLGCGAVLEARTRIARVAAPLLGLACAVLLNGLFRILAHGNALGGSAGLYRAWLAVLLPLVGFVAVGLLSLTAERRAIRSHLAGEVATQLLEPAELQYLHSFWRRQGRYLGLLLRGRLAGALHFAARQNRQVQLAILLRRIAREPEGARRERLTRQAQLVRTALRQAARVVALLLVLLGGGSCTQRSEATMRERQSSAPKPGEAGASVAPAGAVRLAPLDSLVERARVDLDGYWRREVGPSYRSPVAVQAHSQLAARLADCPLRDENAQWCPGDRHIYYDSAWLEKFHRDVGEFAPMFILAHEWGHLVQTIRGELDPRAGLWQLQIELQADCLGGQWTRDAARRSSVPTGAEDQGLATIRRLSDPVDYPWYRKDAHGEALQRIGAYLEGDEGRSCAGADFWRRVKVDPAALQQPETPVAGSLLGSIACRVGRFERTTLFPWAEARSAIATDAVQAGFRSKDGVSISYWSIAFVSAPAAQRALEVAVEQALQKGFRNTKQGPVTEAARVIGEWYLLSGPDEVVLIRNGQKVTGYEGPLGAAWEFGTAQAEFTCSP